MAKYKSIVTTEAGLTLLEDAAYMGHSIQFTALKTGSGTYDGTEDLAAATDLKSVQQTFGVGSVTRKGSDILVRTSMNNNDVTAGYSVTEIGLYAISDDVGAEILYAIIVAETGNEDYFPPYAEAPTSITLEMYMALTETGEAVTFEVLPVAGAYVPVESFNDHVTDSEIHITDAERTAWNKNTTDIEDIVNGTIPVGNALQLGGKDASEYALASELFSNIKDMKGLDFDTATETAIYESTGTPSDSGCTNYPTDHTGHLVVFGGKIITQYYITYLNEIYTRSKFYSGSWSA